MNYIPEIIMKHVIGLSFRKDEIGHSMDEVYIFEDQYILKISTDHKRLVREKERIDWLSDKLSGSSKSIELVKKDGYTYYLRTCVNGYTLIEKDYLSNPDKVINILVKVLDFLRSLDNVDCPFKSNGSVGNDLVHGDLCLPNIIVNDNDELIGFIDVDNLGKGDRNYDLVWLLWSLEYNYLSKEPGLKLLDKLGLEFDINLYHKYLPEEYHSRL